MMCCGVEAYLMVSLTRTSTVPTKFGIVVYRGVVASWVKILSAKYEAVLSHLVSTAGSSPLRKKFKYCPPENILSGSSHAGPIEGTRRIPTARTTMNSIPGINATKRRIISSYYEDDPRLI